MKYCVYCGEQIADESVFCVHCGKMVGPTPLTQQPVKNKSLNVVCLLGFIFSFISTIVGLILSIIGFCQVKNADDKTGKGLALAGIIISSVMIGFVVLVWILLFVSLAAV